MLGENLREMRKRRGMTQESLAIELHVVRQTVSKWEKNLSVPDAEMLQKISEVLEAPVEDLLGPELPKEAEQNEIAGQLSRINEQLAVHNRRARRVWIVAACVLGAILLFTLSAVILGAASFPQRQMNVAISMDAESPLYTRAQVENAIGVAQRDFAKNFHGCTLLGVSYDEDACRAVCEELAQQYGEEQAILLRLDFQTDANGGDGSLNPNSHYENWQWILTRTTPGPWTTKSWGY